VKEHPGSATQPSPEPPPGPPSMPVPTAWMFGPTFFEGPLLVKSIAPR
jgi:hypothetical protein